MGVLRDAFGSEPGGDRTGAARAVAPLDPLVPAAAGSSASATGAAQARADAGAGAGAAPGESELRRRRDALAEQVAELHWDLGGLAYEMAIRDHFRLDVLVRRAAVLQERDAELAEVERLLRMEDGGVAGSCPTCAAPHSRGAMYCWQCGNALMERRSISIDASEADTALLPAGEGASVMDALLAPRERPESDR
jgi:hypothetical protein